MAEVHHCEKEAIIAALQQEKKNDKEQRDDLKHSIAALRAELKEELKEVGRKIDKLVNGSDGGVITKLELQDRDIKQVQESLGKIKYRLENNMVTKQDFFVGNVVGTKVGRIMLWIGIVIVLFLSGGIILPW